jgi:hypothetical protein
MCASHFEAHRYRADADDANHCRHVEPLTGHALESAIDAPVRLCEIPFVKEGISPGVLKRGHLRVTTFDVAIPKLPIASCAQTVPAACAPAIVRAA